MLQKMFSDNCQCHFLTKKISDVIDLKMNPEDDADMLFRIKNVTNLFLYEYGEAYDFGKQERLKPIIRGVVTDRIVDPTKSTILLLEHDSKYYDLKNYIIDLDFKSGERIIAVGSYRVHDEDFNREMNKNDCEIEIAERMIDIKNEDITIPETVDEKEESELEYLERMEEEKKKQEKSLGSKFAN